jgi:hypothetical protein
MSEFNHTIRISWKHGDEISNWNEKCVYALENFGLPGDRFITHCNEDYMEFIFKKEVDAIHFALAVL